MPPISPLWVPTFQTKSHNSPPPPKKNLALRGTTVSGSLETGFEQALLVSFFYTFIESILSTFFVLAYFFVSLKLF